VRDWQNQSRTEQQSHATFHWSVAFCIINIVSTTFRRLALGLLITVGFVAAVILILNVPARVANAQLTANDEAYGAACRATTNDIHRKDTRCEVKQLDIDGAITRVCQPTTVTVDLGGSCLPQQEWATGTPQVADACDDHRAYYDHHRRAHHHHHRTRTGVLGSRLGRRRDPGTGSPCLVSGSIPYQTPATSPSSAAASSPARTSN
jgi:hypothetical protein